MDLFHVKKLKINDTENTSLYVVWRQTDAVNITTLLYKHIAAVITLLCLIMQGGTFCTVKAVCMLIQMFFC